MNLENETHQQKVEGAFLRSVVNQINSVTIGLTSVDDIKQIVEQTLISSLPELLSHPSVANAISTNARSILDGLPANRVDSDDSEILMAVESVWHSSTDQVTHALANTIKSANLTIENLFAPTKYESANFSVLEGGVEFYDFPLSAEDCLEIRVRLPVFGAFFEIRSPAGGHMGSFELDKPSQRVRILPISDGIFELQIRNDTATELNFEFLYRLRNKPTELSFDPGPES
jgi:hypothetical protein